MKEKALSARPPSPSLLQLTFSHARMNAPKSLLFQLANPLASSASLSAVSSSESGCGSSGPGAICACTTSSDAPCARADRSFSASECLCVSYAASFS